VTFGLVVDFDVKSVVTLYSGVPFANTNAGPFNAADYYRYEVSGNAVRAQFEINAPTDDITLVARKGTPLPSLTGFDLISANPGTNDELIVLYKYSSPVPLTPGDWFLAAINVSGGPIEYSITATEFPEYGTNVVITNLLASGDSFCLSWNSVPGVHYCVLGKANLADAGWTTVSPTLTPYEEVATYCVPMPSPFHFFRIREGFALSVTPLSLSAITYSTNGVELRWAAALDSRFNVEWSPSLAPPAWTSFTNLITTTNGVFSFHDDGSQSGGFGVSRYYRLRPLPF
jgi:hypothetical protein